MPDSCAGGAITVDQDDPSLHSFVAPASPGYTGTRDADGVPVGSTVAVNGGLSITFPPTRPTTVTSSWPPGECPCSRCTAPRTR